MKISSAKFFKSAAQLSQCPKPTRPEFAFIGRSNVGKSSLINMLTGNKKLAKTSGTPGKTKLINHFIINDEWYLVDLPGYGFARVGKAQKEEFEKLIIDYCKKRESLVYLFVLVDSRLPLQQVDSEFMQWCGENDIPFVVIFTKIDKLTKNELNRNLSAYKRELLRWWEECPDIIITSSETSRGKDEILALIEENKAYFKLPEKKEDQSTNKE